MYKRIQLLTTSESLLITGSSLLELNLDLLTNLRKFGNKSFFCLFFQITVI